MTGQACPPTGQRASSRAPYAEEDMLPAPSTGGTSRRMRFGKICTRRFDARNCSQRSAWSAADPDAYNVSDRG